MLKMSGIASQSLRAALLEMVGPPPRAQVEKMFDGIAYHPYRKKVPIRETGQGIPLYIGVCEILRDNSSSVFRLFVETLS